MVPKLPLSPAFRGPEALKVHLGCIYDGLLFRVSLGRTASPGVLLKAHLEQGSCIIMRGVLGLCSLLLRLPLAITHGDENFAFDFGL